MTSNVAPAGEAIAVRDVSVIHDGSDGPVVALDRTNLEVDAGASVAVMGPSGCGKSTLLGLLAGLARPTTGSVTIGADTISGLDERARTRFRRSRLGMVYQADNLLPHLTVEENVGLQLAIRGRGSDASSGGRTAAVLARLGIAELARRFPDELSGGQRQRVAIARATVHDPAVLLADEPTGALDDANARAVIGLLADVQRSAGTTLVMVTHDPAMAAHLDTVIALAPPADGGALC